MEKSTDLGGQPIEQIDCPLGQSPWVVEEGLAEEWFVFAPQIEPEEAQRHQCCR